MNDSSLQAPNNRGISPIKELVRLRWTALASQMLVVILVTWIWNPKLPLIAIFSILVLASATNLALTWFEKKRYEKAASKDKNHRTLTVVFAFDVIILTALLSLSGGPANPFSMLYILQVILVAVMTNPKITWFIVGLSSLGFALLFVISIPLPMELGGHGHHSGSNGGYSAHLQGMWFAYTICASGIAVFVSRMSNALLREVEKRQRTARLFGLATLAAGAAHEIGNPLGTIRLAASELENTLNDSGHEDALEDLRLINDEVSRATKVLKRLQNSSAEISGEALNAVEVGKVMNNAMQQIDKEDAIRMELQNGLPLVWWPLEATSQVFAQLLRNALSACENGELIVFKANEKEKGILIEIIDEGHGMSPDVLENVGQPFFTTREGEGMGLGVFIASSLTEHLGGQFQISSQESVGTKVSIWLPLGVKGVRDNAQKSSHR